MANDVLSRACRLNFDDGFLLGMLADLQYTSGQKELAIENLQTAIRKQMHYPWAWNTLQEWGTALGQSDTCQQLAAQLCDEMPHLPITWINRARLAQDPQNTIAWLRKALSLSEHSIDTHIALIDFYITQRSFEQATAQVNDLIWQGQPPVEIQIRSADILAAQSLYGDGCLELEQLLVQHPQCEAAWGRLGEWRQRLQQVDYAVDAMKNLIAINPHSSDNLCSAAQVIIDMEAKSHFGQAELWLEQAFWLSPMESYIGLSWLDWLFKDERFDDIAPVIEQMDRYHQDSYYLVRKIQYDCATNAGESSLRDWQKVVASGINSAWLYATGLESLSKTSFAATAFQCLEDAVLAGDGADDAVYIWGDKLVKNPGGISQIEQMLSQNKNTPIFKPLCRVYMDYYSGIETLPNKAFFETIEAHIKTDIQLFADYGLLLMVCEARKDAIKWFESKPLSKD